MLNPKLKCSKCHKAMERDFTLFAFVAHIVKGELRPENPSDVSYFIGCPCGGFTLVVSCDDSEESTKPARN